MELLSFSLYVLASYGRRNPRANEGGLKYIIVGAFSSAILLYGISMVYSTLGVTRFVDISLALTTAAEVSPALWVGVAFILVGLGFKLGAVPFHMWVPDVYEGAPYPVTAYLAIASKAQPSPWCCAWSLKVLCLPRTGGTNGSSSSPCWPR